MPYFDDAEISKRHKERIAALEKEKRENLTVAQRLTQRALNRKFTIVVPAIDDEGLDIPIIFYVPAGDEWDRMNQLLLAAAGLKNKLNTGKGQEKMKEIQEEIFNMLADLAVDESLDVEWWRNPANYGADESFPVSVVKEMFTVLGKMRDEGGSFRKVTDGSNLD